MPLGGVDTRYNVSWEEQDKIRRRLAIKDQLKQEAVRKKFSPYLALKGEIAQDPAVSRFMDLRKRGRLPNTPLHPKKFYAMIFAYLIPIVLLKEAVDYYRTPYLRAMEVGDIPYEERQGKSQG